MKEKIFDPAKAGVAFAKKLREAVKNPSIWIPGIENGALGNCLKELSQLSDAEIVSIIKESCEAGKEA